MIWERYIRKFLVLSDLRHAMSELKVESLAVGRDGRNRSSLFPFGARTGRNTPSANRFIFGPSKWLRGLIKPEFGNAIAYIDWCFRKLV